MTGDDKVQECGRSMVEIIGVLVIIALLLMGGLWGYVRALDTRYSDTLHEDLLVRGALIREGRQGQKKVFTTTLPEKSRYMQEIQLNENISGGHYISLTVPELKKSICNDMASKTYPGVEEVRINGKSYPVVTATRSKETGETIGTVLGMPECEESANAFSIIFPRTTAQGAGARQEQLPCVGDGDCPGKYVCESGKCVNPNEEECTEDTDCPSGYVCGSNGKCDTDPPSCTPSCPSGQTCFNGECKTITCVNGSCCPTECATCNPELEQCTSCKGSRILLDGKCVDCSGVTGVICPPSEPKSCSCDPTKDSTCTCDSDCEKTNTCFKTDCTICSNDMPDVPREESPYCCKAGYYRSGDGKTLNCVKCDRLEFSTACATDCGTCPNGRQSNATGSGCTNCSLGNTNCGCPTNSVADGQGSCVCAKGYTISTDNMNCVSCSGNTYNNEFSNAACIDCGYGTVNEDHTSCTCQPGAEQKNGTCWCTFGTYDEDSKTCKECLVTTHCDGTKKCDTDTNKCVDCLEDEDCPSGKFCVSGSCVGCDVKYPTTPYWDETSQTCVACLNNGHCAEDTNMCPISSTAKVCDTSTHTCKTCGELDSTKPLRWTNNNGQGTECGTCYACANDETGATKDTGCTDDKPLCNGSTSYAGSACYKCVNDQTGATQDTGCSDDTPMCGTTATSGFANGCYKCINDSTDGADTGCTDPTKPVCDAAAGAFGTTCTGCMVNSDCPSLKCNNGTCQDCPDTTPYWDETSQTCVACLNNGHCAEDTNMCPISSTAKVCDTSTHTCKTCGELDSTKPLRWKNNNGQGSECGTCYTCANDKTGATQDTGCSDPTKPLCDGEQGRAGGGCYKCVNDQTGATQDTGCTDPDKPMCGITILNRLANDCYKCINDSTDGTDTGCTDPTKPMCDAAADAFGTSCTGCTVNSDCPSLKCNNGTCKTCSDPTKPYWDDSSNQCVECLYSNHCATDTASCPVSTSSKVCHNHVCKTCTEVSTEQNFNPLRTLRRPHSTNGGCNACYTCVNNQTDAIKDIGCTDDKPMCDTTTINGFANQCVQCMQDSDCGTDKSCVNNQCKNCPRTITGTTQNNGYVRVSVRTQTFMFAFGPYECAYSVAVNGYVDDVVRVYSSPSSYNDYPSHIAYVPANRAVHFYSADWADAITGHGNTHPCGNDWAHCPANWLNNLTSNATTWTATLVE